MKTILLGIAVAVAVLVGVLFLRGKEAPVAALAMPGKEASVMGNRRHAPDVVLAIKPGVPLAPRAVAEAPKPSPLMQEYLGRKGRKALYDRIAQSPSPSAEERYIAAEILNDCRRMGSITGADIDAVRTDQLNRARASISEKDPAREKRLAAIDAMFGRVGGTPVCAGFESMAIKASDVREAMAKAADAGDPRARARLVEIDVWAPHHGPDGNVDMSRGFQKLPSISDAQLATLKEALASNDPAALMVAGRLLSSSMADMQVRAGPEERAVNPQAFYDAWQLAACDAGRDCGPRSELLLGGCFAFGDCDARDLREHLFFYRNSPQQSQLVAEYQAQITRAIQTRDWSWFQFHRGPPVVGMMASHPPP